MQYVYSLNKYRHIFLSCRYRRHLPEIYSRELIDTIFEQFYWRMGKLVSIGVLKEPRVGRERLFIHPKLIQLITKDNNEFTDYKF